MPIPAIDTEHARQMFRVRAEVFEGKDLSTDGLVYQELARALLAAASINRCASSSATSHISSQIDLSNKGDYDAITQAYLTRLADHDFSSLWLDGIREALAPIVAPITQLDNHPPAAASVPPRIVAGPTLKEAFDARVANRGRTGRDRTTDEFRLAIARCGRHVTGPSGSLLSKGHPLGATGLAQCYELTHQLRGSAGDRQVEAMRFGLQHNVGLGGACVVTLYGRAG